MIKTELDNSEQDNASTAGSKNSDQFFIITAIVAAFVAGVIGVVLIRYNQVQKLPDNPARYKNVQPLPLGSSGSGSVGPVKSGSSLSNQAFGFQLVNLTADRWCLDAEMLD